MEHEYEIDEIVIEALETMGASNEEIEELKKKIDSTESFFREAGPVFGRLCPENWNQRSVPWG